MTGRSRIKKVSQLERVTHLCLIAVCILSVALLLESRFRRSAASAPSSDESRPAATLLGRRLELPGVNWKLAKTNAILYLNTHCHFCIESAPFYRRLAEIQLARRRETALFVLSSEAPSEMRNFLSREGIAVAEVSQVSSSTSGLRNTPTVLLTDGRGMVQRVFVGKLAGDREEEVLGFLRTGMLK
jgi:hypothetical protein